MRKVSRQLPVLRARSRETLSLMSLVLCPVTLLWAICWYWGSYEGRGLVERLLSVCANASKTAQLSKTPSKYADQFARCSSFSYVGRSAVCVLVFFSNIDPFGGLASVAS